MQTVLIEVTPKGCFDLSGIQIFDDVSNRFTLTIPLEDLADNDCFVLIDIEGVACRYRQSSAGTQRGCRWFRSVRGRYTHL